MLASIHDTIIDLAVDITTVLPHPDNPREHDDDVIAESLILNGQYGPIVVQASSRRILAGNGTYAAAMRLGWTHIAAVVLDVDDAAGIRILLADNRLNEGGSNDPDALVALLRDLDGSFGGTGYTPTDYNELVRLVDHTSGSEPVLGDLDPTGLSSGVYEPVVSMGGGLKSLSLTYPAATFDDIVRSLMKLRQSESESFTAVVVRIAGDALASRS